jgi:hypothetical protein
LGQNGDRWTVLHVTRDGTLKVRHTRNGRTAILPAGYVSTVTELGYATTVHGAQGVTVDTMHGLATGQESRQQLYTMLTRGRTTNHLYLPVVGDGDLHTILRPDNLQARTATELLEQILARDATPPSATTLQQEQHEPAVRLGHAAARYLDALHLAAEHLADAQMITNLDNEADQLISGLTEETAWPALRARLLLLAADGADPVAELREVAQLRELDSAHNRAAVFNWRLDDIPLQNKAAPLPWLPGVPDRIARNPDWGPYLAGRSRLISDLADQVRTNGQAAAPAWTAERSRPLPARLVADLRVWRAAMQVEQADLRPTGHEQRSLLARIWQHRLEQQLATHDIAQWADLLTKQIPILINDSFLLSLTQRLENLDRTGFDPTSLVQSAAAKGPLPDDHPAAALWWRILDDLSTRPPRRPDHQPPPDVPHSGATRLRQQPYRATQKPRSTIGPGR